MPWAIDRAAEVPIGVQLAWALRTRIGTGELRPGQRLPGLREMAEAVGVNLNTVRTVYQRLEHEGLVESQQGSGTFVAASRRGGGAVGTLAASAALAARETGVDPRDVAAALYVTPDPREQTILAENSSELAQRRLLRRQIAAFESALGEIEAANPGVAPAPEPTRAGSGPTLLNASELEQVRTRLVRRLASVQAAIDVLDEQPLDPRPRARAADARASEQAPATKPQPNGAAKRKRGPRASVRTLPAST